MECRDVRELTDSFLGEELLTETNHEILRHLDTCPVCRADLDARRALRDGVRRAFHRATELEPRPEFMVGLRTMLQNTAYQASARRGISGQGWWALAAMVLLAVTIGLAYRGRERIAATGTLARAAVGDHLNCALNFRLAEKPVTLSEAATR
jgi:anti-sigma factor RsiW